MKKKVKWNTVGLVPDDNSIITPHFSESIPFHNIQYSLKMKPFCSYEYARAFVEGAIFGILTYTPFEVFSSCDNSKPPCPNFKHLTTMKRHERVCDPNGFPTLQNSYGVPLVLYNIKAKLIFWIICPKMR